MQKSSLINALCAEDLYSQGGIKNYIDALQGKRMVSKEVLENATKQGILKDGRVTYLAGIFDLALIPYNE